MNVNGKLNYIEFPAADMQATKDFFGSAFGWTFEDFGPEYTAFSDQGLDGGFYKSEMKSSAENGATLAIFYSNDLEATQAKVEAAGGTINQAIFSFPGGRRFHFIEPSGNELAVWTDLGI